MWSGNRKNKWINQWTLNQWDKVIDLWLAMQTVIRKKLLNISTLDRVRTEIWLWFSMIFQDKTTLFSKLFKVFYTWLYKQNIIKLA